EGTHRRVSTYNGIITGKSNVAGDHLRNEIGQFDHLVLQGGECKSGVPFKVMNEIPRFQHQIDTPVAYGPEIDADAFKTRRGGEWFIKKLIAGILDKIFQRTTQPALQHAEINA